MTAVDPAVALTVEELASLYRSAHGPNWRTDGAASVDRALLARVHAELTALRARVGEVERYNPLVIEREDALALRNLLGAARRGLAWASVINRAEVVIERLLAERERKEHP